MDQLLARLAAHAPAAVAGGLAVSVLLAKSLTGKSKRRAPAAAQPQPPGVQPGQLLRARLHVLRRQQRVRLHVQVLKQQSPIASPQDTAIAPELPAPALLLGAQPDTAPNQQDDEDAADSPADPSSPAHANDSAAHPTPAAAGTTATSAPSASAAGVTRRSVTIDPAVEAEQATREAAKKQQTLADVLRELHQSKRKNAKLRDRLARLEASLTPAAAAATAAAAAGGAADGRASVQGAIGATAATAAVTAAAAALAAAAAATTPRARAGTAAAGDAANEQACSAADTASGAPGRVSDTTDRGVAAGSSSAGAAESADADVQGSSDRDAPSKANRSPTKLPSKSPAKPCACTTLTGNRGDQRPKAPNAASLSAQAAAAAPSAAPAAATAAPCAPRGTGAAAGSASSSNTADGEMMVLPSQPSQPTTAPETAAATGTSKAKALSAAATGTSSAASSSIPGASLVPGEIMRLRVAPGDPVTSRPGGLGEGRRGKSATVLDVMRERKAAKDEQARLVAKLAAQVAEIQSHNAALMDAFRSSNAKLAHLTEENASLRSEMASLKGNGDGGMSTPTNGSELGHFKESLLHPHGRTTQSETPFSDTTSKDGMSASIGGGSSIGGGLFRYRSAAQKRGSAAAAGDGEVSMPGTPASSAVAPPAQSVMALLDTFGGRGF